MIWPSRETYQNIPEEMRHPRVKRWVCFRCIPQPDGTVSKMPLTSTGTAAAVNDSRTWCAFPEALKAMEFCVGNSLGFALGSDYKLAVVDLDKCFQPDGTLTPTAQKFVDRLGGDSFVERSISGGGTHIFFWYTGPQVPANPAPGVEVYTSDRFVVLTGVPL